MLSHCKRIEQALRARLSLDRPHKRRSKLRRLILESLEDRRLMTVDWRNPTDSLDVNGDGFVVPVDALLVINYLNSEGAQELPEERDTARPYVDVNGDQFATPLDALLVINHLNTGNSGHRKLAEKGTLASELEIAVTLGQSTGKRIYQVQLDASFDYSDQSAAVEDLLAVYLVDPQTATTILDRGVPGTALFTLAGSTTESLPERVSWDGSVLTIDLTDLADHHTGVLKFQLLSSDTDKGTQVVVKPLSNSVDPESIPADRLPLTPSSLRPAGAALDMASLASAANVEPSIANVRYNAVSDTYLAELRLRNDGAALGGNIVVAFPGLPSGVSLVNASGRSEDGTPYINVSPTIARGGLQTETWSAPIGLEFHAVGDALFQLKPQVFADLNRPPVLAPLAPQSMVPGGVLRIPLSASDPDGDAISYSLQQTGGGRVSGVLQADGVLVFRPAPSEIGTYQFSVVASDGSQSASQPFTLTVTADPVTSTRVSGQVLDVDGTPLANIPVEIGAVRALTLGDGSFTLDLGSGVIASDTLKIRGESYTGNLGSYPFIAEKLALLLERPVYASVNNVIERPIYLPKLDVASGATIQPTEDTTVTSAAMPGAKVVVAAGTLMNQQGTPFTGVLSMTEVPVSLTPAALPDGLMPDLVVTIQPGEMVFTRPTPLALPNTAGYAPGALQDLWSINPVTGQFEIVGLGKVSADGSVIETISGGIRNSSWHFFGPPAPTGPKVKDDPRNKKPGGCGDDQPGTSSCEMHSGALNETHALVTYQSQGVTRGLTLTYDSLRADPRPIVHFTFDDLDPGLYSVPSAVRLVAKLSVNVDGMEQQVPGFVGNAYGLSGGEHFWRLPAGSGSVDAALQVDMGNHPSGIYQYSLQSGMLGYAGDRGFLGTLEQTSGQVVSVNTIDSPLGAGWGISGLLELVETEDGSVLVIDGDGGEEVYTAKVGGGYAHPAGLFSTLSKQPDGTFRRTWPDQTVERFNDRHKLASVTDRNGNVTTYQYDGSDRLVNITDPVGLQTVISYQAGRVEITDPGGRTTRLELDAAGNLVRVVDPDGSTRSWNYDAKHRLTGETDQLGNSERSHYGPHGRLTDVLRKDGTARRYQPLDLQGLYPVEQTTADPVTGDNPTAGRVPAPNTAFVDANGNAIVSTLDSQGQVVSSRDNVGPLQSVLRNPDNLPVRIVDAGGQSTWITYDAQGNILTVSEDFGRAARAFGNALEFDGVDDIVEVPDAPSLRPASFTVEGWVRFDATAEMAAIFSKPLGDSILNSYQLYYAQGQLTGTVSDGAAYYLVSAPWQPVNGDWSHVAFTFDDSANTSTLFIDGAEVASRTVPVSLAYDSHPLTIGGDYDYAVRQFPLKGAVDEVRLWSAARSRQQIRDAMFQSLIGNEAGLSAYYQFEAGDDSEVFDTGLHDNDGALLGGPTPIDSTVTVGRPIEAPAGLVGWWTGDGYTNEIVGGHNGVLRNGTAFRPGMGSLGFDFDGQDDYVRVPDATDGSLDIVGDLTISAWINPRQIAGQQRTIVQKRPSAGNDDVAYGFFLESDGRLAFTSRLGGGAFTVIATSAQVPINEWTHVAVTIRGNSLSLFIDGAEAAVSPFSVTRVATDGPVTIGATVVGGTTSSPFLGSIDEVQLFSRALATEEIRAIALAERAGQLKPKVFDAASDFSVSGNPNGTWTYGYSTPQDPTFHPATLQLDNGQIISWGSGANGPFAARALSRQYAAYITITHPADLINLDPSLDGRNSVTQWTAPQAGTYRILGSFIGLDSTTTAASILLNDDAGAPLLSGNIDGRNSQVPFALTRTLQAGDRIQFTVGARGNSLYDSTGLSATIVLEGSTLNSETPGAESTLAKTTYSYDSAFNQVTGIIDPIGRQTLFSIDPANGNATSMINVVGAVGGGDDRVTQLTYTPSGQVESVTDALGIVTRYTYDALGRLTQIREAFGTAAETSQQLEYDSVGRIIGSTDGLGRRTQFRWDAMNRLTEITYADGNTTSYTYDQRGNQRSQTNSVGQTERWTYDVLDRLRTATDASAGVTRYAYDLAGNVQSVTDPLGQAERYQYDTRGRTVAVVDPAGSATRYQYDALDQVVAVRDAAGNRTSWTYDGMGRVARRTDPFGMSSHYRYDAAGQLTEVRDRTGRVTKFTYDDLGQMIAEDWLNADSSLANQLQYSYDAAGRLTQTADQVSAIVYTLDSLGRVTGESVSGPDQMPASLLEYTYDAIGNVATQRDTINGVTGAINTLTYDSRNRLSRLVQTGNGVATKRVDFTYNATGQFKALVRSSDVAGQNVVATTSFHHDAKGRLTQIAHRSAANELLNSFDYQYDVADRITRITDVDGAHSYAYDVRGQLASAVHADPLLTDEGYTYDSTGNRTSSHLHGTDYRIGDGLAGTSDGNRLSSDGRYRYSYDAEGRLVRRLDATSGQLREFVYDHRNRLIEVTDRATETGPSTQVAKYTYDVLDRRIAKAVDTSPGDGEDGVTTYYVYAGQDVIAEVVDPDGTGPAAAAVAKRYLHGPAVDQVLAQDDGASVQWMLSDHLGTITDLVDSQGQVVNHLQYDSFGNLIAESDPAVDSRYQYTGREFDAETGLQYNRARYYDAAIGRFVSEDPIGFAGGDANLYRYVSNNPTGASDPLGLRESIPQWVRNRDSVKAAQAAADAANRQTGQKLDALHAMDTPGATIGEASGGSSSGSQAGSGSGASNRSGSGGGSRSGGGPAYAGADQSFFFDFVFDRYRRKQEDAAAKAKAAGDLEADKNETTRALERQKRAAARARAREAAAWKRRCDLYGK